MLQTQTGLGQRRRYSDLLGMKPLQQRISRTRSDRPCRPPSFLYNAYRVISGGKAAAARGKPPTRLQRQVYLLCVFMAGYSTNFTSTFYKATFLKTGMYISLCQHFLCCRAQSFITNLQCSVFYSRLFLIIRCACRQNTAVRTVKTKPLLSGAESFIFQFAIQKFKDQDI